ncbi:MAG: hypothetical protein D9N14_03135 [Ketobacter sp.]|nr:MAG: hypothetical protein D9N14_03135 [Ketobacter sp.]
MRPLTRARATLQLTASLLVWFLLTPSTAFSQATVSIAACNTAPTPDQLARIGDWIYRNECNRDPRCLVEWNQGEAFPSLGIGHFIWYPQGVQGRFTESFPALIAYLQQQNIALPTWLATRSPFTAPWADRETFLQQRDQHPAVELRQFLAQHTAAQSGFMLQRLQRALPAILDQVPEAARGQVSHQLQAMCRSELGWYALVDYVNFKGEGLNPQERYQNRGWGLLQVLLLMAPNRDIHHSFADAAASVLTQRAKLAHNSMERERWLNGWLKRVNSYRALP